MIFLIAQIFGLAGLIGTIAGNYQTNKNRVLICQILANFLCLAQYVLLKAFAGAITFFVAIFRCYVFYYYDKKEKPKSVFILLLFSMIIAILGIFTFVDWFSLFPIISAIIYTYGVWQDNLKKFRIIAFYVPVVWIIYNLHVGAYIGVVLSIIEAIATLIAIIKIDIKKDKYQERTKLLIGRKDFCEQK